MTPVDDTARLRAAERDYARLYEFNLMTRAENELLRQHCAALVAETARLEVLLTNQCRQRRAYERALGVVGDASRDPRGHLLLDLVLT